MWFSAAFNRPAISSTVSTRLLATATEPKMIVFLINFSTKERSLHKNNFNGQLIKSGLSSTYFARLHSCQDPLFCNPHHLDDQDNRNTYVRSLQPLLARGGNNALTLQTQNALHHQPGGQIMAHQLVYICNRLN